jgi:TonB family protein
MTTLVTPIMETIVKSSVILGFTFFVTMALRRKSAALRHMVWTAGLLCALALPLFSLAMPAWHVRPLRAVQHSEAISAPQWTVTESGPTSFLPPLSVPAAPSRFTPERMLFLVWMIGVLSVASLILREAVRLARVAFGASVVQQSSWRELAYEISQALLLRRHVRLMRNPNASVLGTWGTFRPRIILPRESESWSSERMRVVLGHELAHVKRNDWLIQIIAETARAIYWFNPLFWIACMQLRRESEHACDDAAINLGAQIGMDGPMYAGHVLDLARTLKHSGQPDTAALAMASTSNLERRLLAMLNPSLDRSIAGKGTVIIVALLALCLTLPLAAVSSQAPAPAVSVIRAMEFVSPAPIPTAASAVEAPPVTQRPLPRTVAVVAPASPAAEAVQPVAAQNQDGTLSGTVSDPTGALVPGVRVSMTAQSSGIVRQTLTREAGNFAFTQLPPDNYSVTAELPGFQKVALSYVLLDPGSSAKFNIKMHIAPMQIVVSITAQSPPGLKCFSIFGATKSDGTPFTEADCPGGTIVMGLPPKPAAQPANAPNSTIGVVIVDSPAATESQLTNPVNGRRDPIRVGGDLQAASLLSHANPAYPSEARNKGIEGVVVVSGIVTVDGHLQSLKIIGSSNPLLETSVIETLASWTYKPALLNKEPVEVISTITLNFTMGR